MYTHVCIHIYIYIYKYIYTFFQENIMYETVAQDRVKLIDFGLSAFWHKDYTIYSILDTRYSILDTRHDTTRYYAILCYYILYYTILYSPRGGRP